MRHFVAGFVAALVLQAGIANAELVRRISSAFTGSYPNSNTQVVQTWQRIENIAASTADTDLGLSPGTVAAAMGPCINGQVATLVCGSDETTVHVHTPELP